MEIDSLDALFDVDVADFIDTDEDDEKINKMSRKKIHLKLT